MKILLTTIMAFLIAGCVSYAPSIPEGYTGDIATINDSFQRQSRSKANFYYIKLIDGKPIHNSLNASASASYGKGAQLVTMGASRSVPVKPLSIHIVGQVYHSAPVGAMFNAGKNYLIEGEVDFTPEKDQTYLITGSLSEAYSAVWIADINGNVVSKVIEDKSPSYTPAQTSNDQQKKKEISREELFLNLAGGESESLVVSKLGKPDGVSIYKGNAFTGKPGSITYQYNGLGNIQFSAQNEKPLFIERVTSAVKFSNDIPSIKMQLASTGPTLQSLAKGYWQQNNIEVEILDLFAEKIWSEKGTDDPYVVDALAWLCKTLSKSNNSRYRSLLQDIANEASSKKLKKHAKENLDLLPTTKVEQFIPDAK